jgi:MarR family transcriptional regulator, organic hydroperoxide resistance regulator
MSTLAEKHEFEEKWKHALAPYNLGYKIKLVSQLMYRDFLEKLEPHGLTPFHYLVLCCLWEEDGLPTSSIAEKLKQVGAMLTGVIDRMEERSLVYRERDPSDRRVVRIWLTPEGEKLKNILPALGEKTIFKATEGLSDRDYKMLMKLLDRILQNFA